jgi:hypothetical protein
MFKLTIKEPPKQKKSVKTRTKGCFIKEESRNIGPNHPHTYSYLLITKALTYLSTHIVTTCIPYEFIYILINIDSYQCFACKCK